MPPLVVDDLPPALLRVVPERAWAASLITTGELWFSKPSLYHKTADVREDGSEGQGYARVRDLVTTLYVDHELRDTREPTEAPGLLNLMYVGGGPVYIASLSASTVRPTVARSFGRWAVRIDEPQRFLTQIAGAVERAVAADPRLALRQVLFVDAFPVRYTKGELMDRTDIEHQEIRMSYGQKAARHASEAEFRVAVMLSGSGSEEAPDQLIVRAGSLSDIAELVDLDMCDLSGAPTS